MTKAKSTLPVVILGTMKILVASFSAVEVPVVNGKSIVTVSVGVMDLISVTV